MAGKYGTPYFSNFINSELNPSDVRSMCCRLRLCLNELTSKGGGLFGANEFTGSIGVVTINLPQLFYRMNGRPFNECMDELDKIMDIAKDSLEYKRLALNNFNNLNGGRDTLYPYTKRYLTMGFQNHFSTIGVVGMNEAMKMWMNADLLDDDAIAIANAVLKHMREKLLQYQQETGHLYNLEASPAEGTSYRLAKHDLKVHPDIYHAGTKESPYYTNSSHLPVNATDDIFKALEKQEALQTAYTGGTVLHGYLGEQISGDMAAYIVKTAFTNFKLPYLSITPTFSVCPDHGYIVGEQWTCPHCGKNTEVYSRITGYLRSVERFNIGKKQEFKDRKVYKTNGKS